MDTQSAFRSASKVTEGRTPDRKVFSREPDRGVGRSGNASGFATVHFVIAAGFSMLFFVLLSNLLVVQYGRAAVRVALDEGVRHGARSGGDAPGCEKRVRQVLDGLLGGKMGSGVSYLCRKDRERTRAAAEVRFPGWLPGLPDYRFDMAATAASERR